MLAEDETKRKAEDAAFKPPPAYWADRQEATGAEKAKDT